MVDTRGVWREVLIAGKRADVYEPQQPSPHSFVVLHLHGHGLTTLKHNPHFSRSCATLAKACPSLQG